MYTLTRALPFPAGGVYIHSRIACLTVHSGSLQAQDLQCQLILDTVMNPWSYFPSHTRFRNFSPHECRNQNGTLRMRLLGDVSVKLGSKYKFNPQAPVAYNNVEVATHGRMKLPSQKLTKRSVGSKTTRTVYRGLAAETR